MHREMSGVVDDPAGVLPARRSRPPGAEALWEASSRQVLGGAGLGARACPRCSMALSPAARFCRRCGTAQSMGAGVTCRGRGEVTVHVAAERAGGRRRGLHAPLRVAALALLILGSLLLVSPFGGGQVAAAESKVVIIVGPVDALTGFYRSEAENGAAEARRFTHNVVTLHSPDATWPAVRAALTGASLVIYMGHGNGWPSRYSSSLVPQYQDGLGLNPVAGGGDAAHQYFGESYLAREVRLAPHALVLLHHLCYASGNSEPGFARGAVSTTALSRADNYAAGWLAAGPTPSWPTRSMARPTTSARSCPGRARSSRSGVHRHPSTATSSPGPASARRA